MKNSQRGNILIFAAIIGVIMAGVAVVAYKMLNHDDSNTYTPVPDIKVGVDSDTTTPTEPATDKVVQTPGTETSGTETATDSVETVDSGTIEKPIQTGNDTPIKSQSPIEFSQYAPAADSSSAVSAINKFALDLYSRYKGETAKNVFFSPYSIFSALEMTYEGARGKTADEIYHVFHFSADAQTRIGSFAKLYSQINPQNASYQLSTANALWAQKDYPFYQGYLKTIETYYGGKATNLDFKTAAESARQTINNWVSSKTNDKIPELFAKGSLDQTTRLVLTNAIYFKGKWAVPFESFLTQEKDFTAASGTQVKAQMMNRQSSMNYVETNDYQAVELPYKDNDLSMIVILPKTGKMGTVESQLFTSGLGAVKQGMNSQLADVFLPKFKFDASYNMNDTLSQMGMPTAFDPDNADFTGMYDRSKAQNENLYIALVVHKAYVAVDEEGTEAAAATGVAMAGATAIMNPVEPKIFNADHPFIFAIVHNQSGSILFMGKVNDPTK